MNDARVGIFWLVAGKEVIDSVALGEAEDYGDFRVHPGGHYSVWEELQRAGTVPADMEYEYAPRGRVIYNRMPVSSRYWLTGASSTTRTW